MRTAWLLVLLAFAGLEGTAAAQVVARGVETYPVGGFRLVTAAGTPDTALCGVTRAGSMAAGDGATTLWMCDGTGWVKVAGVGAVTASAVPVADVAEAYTGTDVEAVLAELPGIIVGLVDSVAAALSAHESASPAHAASAVSVADALGIITATDVEGALAEGASGVAAAQALASAAIAKATATVQHQILRSTGASAWEATTVSDGSILGRPAGGSVGSLTPAQARTAAGLDATAGGGGAALIGADATGRTVATGATVDAQLDQVDTALAAGGTPPPVLLGVWRNAATWSQGDTTNVQYAASTYDWTTAARSHCVVWPRTALWAARSAGWGLRARCRMSTATAGSVAMDCKSRDGTEYCTEQTASTVGSYTEETTVFSFGANLPTSDDFICLAFREASAITTRLYACSILAYPL